MAKQHFVKKARKSIWMIGEKIIRQSSKGPVTDFDRSMPFKTEEGVEQDKLLVGKGESYYWCKFKYRTKQVKKVPFTQDELTYGRYGKNEWTERLEDFQSRAGDGLTEDEAEELSNEIEEYRDELQSRLDNMPDQLQESSVLNERIEELDSLLEEVANIDFD